MDCYPYLKQWPDTLKLTVLKWHKKVPKAAKKKFDRLYYDEETVNIKQMTDYITACGLPQLISINLTRRKASLENKAKGNKPKLRTYITKQVTNLKEN